MSPNHYRSAGRNGKNGCRTHSADPPRTPACAPPPHRTIVETHNMKTLKPQNPLRSAATAPLPLRLSGNVPLMQAPFTAAFFFNSFPGSSNDLPSRHSHNWYSFVFYSNIIISTCECGYRRAYNSLFSLMNVSFQTILADLSLCSLTLSVLSPRILCVEENDLETIFYLVVPISQSNTSKMIEYVWHQAI